MKFSLPFFRRKSADTPRNALVVLHPEPPTASPAKETRSRWELAAEQLASMNAAKEEAIAPGSAPPQLVPAESEFANAVTAAVLLPEQALPASEPVVARQVEVAAAPAAVAPPVETATPLGMTREDVVAAFHLFLRRDPESEEVIEPYLDRERERLLGAFLTSAEFLQWPEHLRLIVEVAQAIELRQLVQKPRAGVPVLSRQDLDAARRILQPAAPAQQIEPSLEGQSVDWALACLMRSEAFQRNPFNAKLVTGLAHEIAGQFKPKTESGAEVRLS